MKRLIIDLDNTLCVAAAGQDQALDPNQKYAEARPVTEVIDQLRTYRAAGFEIVISTSRNMRTFNGDVDAIRQNTLPIIVAWLDEHAVPYDDVLVGKPWCGFDGFYVDDRAVRPSEFTSMTYEQIRALIEPGSAP